MISQVIFLLFLIALALQFSFYMAYFKNFTSHIPALSSNTKPSVSVVICAHNEADNLQKHLPKIIQQKYDDLEIIIVNDRSTDHTEALLSTFGKTIKVISVLSKNEHKSPKKHAIEQGFLAAKGDFVLLTDADCIPNSTYWVEHMVSSIDENTELVLGFSPYSSAHTFLNRFIQFDTYFTGIQYLSFALANEAFMGIGRNLMVKKSAFFRVNGFSGFEHILYGDDDFLVSKIATSKNTKICYSSESQTISEPKTTWKEWIKQKRRHFSAGLHYSSAHKVKVGLFQQSYVWMYLTFFILLFSVFKSTFLLTMVVFLLLLRITLIYKASFKKLGAPLPFYLLVVLDVIYFFYFLLVGISVLIKKTHSWS